MRSSVTPNSLKSGSQHFAKHKSDHGKSAIWIVSGLVLALALLTSFLAFTGNTTEDNFQRNSYMLKNQLASRGYDWWWHSLVAENKQTGELKPFFFEYLIVNPALGGDRPIFGQLAAADKRREKLRPSYGMIKAGTWGKDARQVHNFYSISNVSASYEGLHVKIGSHYATESKLVGSVDLSADEAATHPEYLSQSGKLSWNINAKKLLTYNVGYGASRFFQNLNAFGMFWHIQGMLTEYEGIIIYNDVEYAVKPETSYGYQDKNWGTDFSNPWIWLNSNNFVSRTTGEKLQLTSLDVGGAQPIAFGLKLPQTVLVAFYYKGKLYDFNFSKFWTFHSDSFKVVESEKQIEWHILSSTLTYKIEIHFDCDRSTMLKINYENPDGEHNHKNLWNCGYAKGNLTLWERDWRTFSWEVVDILDGSLGGAEYGYHSED